MTTLPSGVETPLTPPAIAAYLAAQGWVRTGSTAARETWSGPMVDSDEDGCILLPIDSNLCDFGRRLQEAVWGIEEGFGLSTTALVDAVTATTRLHRAPGDH